jgi:hypothetical protein
MTVTTRNHRTNTRSTPETTYETVTPALAREWLGHNTRNRGVKTARVALYARDMQDGKWQLTGESIKFAVDGTLLDGQNRLHACIEADVPFLTAVTRGLDPLSQQVMDGVAPRTGADALKMRGYDNTSSLAAVVACHAWWRYGLFRHCMHRPNGRDRLTVTELVEHAIEYPGLVDATRLASHVRRVMFLPVGSIGCAIHETSLIDADTSGEFFNRIAQFESKGIGDPVSTLLRRTALMRERREQIENSTGLYLLFKSWNAVRQNEELTRFVLGSEDRGWVTIPQPI